MNLKKNQKPIGATSILRKFICLSMVMFFGFLLQPNNLNAQINNQEIIVKGKVFDENKEPVIGASIVVEGTSLGTVTDLDGNFSIKASANSVIAVSYIGYVTQKLKATTALLVINLKEDSETLDEVVVVGYGSVKRANLTGAVSSVSMKDMSDIPSPNLASVLMGTMPGVSVSEATGNPIGNATIRVRINGSWNAEAPLYVIDGFIRDVDAFNLLDASEIESISVLKDASAAVYGVRGAGGVILVATKQGKTGKAKVSYSSSFGVNQGIQMPDMMSAYEHGVALNDLWQQNITYKGANPETTKFFTEAELNKMRGLNYDWLEQGWKNSGNNRHTLNVSGGTEDVKYFIGGSYMFADGNFDNLNMNRYGLRMGVDAKLAKNLKANFSMSYSSKQTEMPLNQKDAEPERMYGTFSSLVRAPRFIPAYINGLPVGNSIPTNDSHPLEVMNSGSYRKNKTNDITAGLSLEYNIEKIKGLKIGISGNYSNNSGNGKQLSKPYYVYGFIPEGDTQNSYLLSSNQYPITDPLYRRRITNNDRLYESASFSYSYQLNPKISYANKFGKHDVSALAMYEQSESGGNGLNAFRNTVIIENYEILAGYGLAEQGNSSNINTLSRRQSYIGRLNYNYDEKYFFESATRYESSTNFAPGYRWGLFPSVSVGWRVSEEDFFKDNVTFMDNLKLRGSYGRLGNDKVNMNQWRSSYGTTSGAAYVGGSSLLSVLHPTVEGLVYLTSSWEKTDSYNVGLDARLFNDFTFGVDGFYRHTFDILDDFKSEFPQSAGINAATPKLNKGIQDSWGGEFELGYNKKLNKDWDINIKGNISYSTNRVIEKSQNPGVIGTWKDELGRIRGGEVGYFSTGIARTQAEVDAYIAGLKANSATGTITVLGLTEENLKPGMLMYQDVGSAPYRDDNGNWHDGAPDGNITDDDQRIISKYDSAPFSYGFSLGFTWKNLKVDALFNGAFGNDVLFEKGFWDNASGGSRTGDFLSEKSNMLSEWYGNYWTETNTNAKYPRLDTYSFRNQRSTFWMRNGHTLRLRNINVSYMVPKNLTKAVGIEQLRVFFSGTNLLTIINPYPYKDASVGFWSDYPMIQSFNFGLNLNF
jgi:TonB-linked SusC/RagA family outer membrane protein